MSVLNYSKWDNIEISDDEDDTHPNIHTPSLFKWRHEARVQRMQELEVEKERVSEGKKETEAALKRAKTAGHTTEDLEKQLKDWKLKVNMFHRLYIIDFIHSQWPIAAIGINSQGTDNFPFSYFANPTLKLIKVIKDIKNINTFDKTRTHGLDFR